MCVISAVIDSKTQELEKYLRKDYNTWITSPANPVRKTIKQVLEEFEAQVKSAAKYDEMTGQPHCEDEEKKKKLKNIAKQLGIEINFI